MTVPRFLSWHVRSVITPDISFAYLFLTAFERYANKYRERKCLGGGEMCYIDVPSCRQVGFDFYIEGGRGGWNKIETKNIKERKRNYK